MSEVKIYSCDPDLMSHPVNIDGSFVDDFVLASDYVALEQKLLLRQLYRHSWHLVPLMLLVVVTGLTTQANLKTRR
jgi:hypothetical protein